MEPILERIQYILPFMIPITLFLVLAAVIIVLITVRHRERSSIIEKGLGPEEIKVLYGRGAKGNISSVLKWGILFVFGGIALVLGTVLRNVFHVDGGAITFGMVVVFLGAGLLLYYRLASKKPAQEE